VRAGVRHAWFWRALYACGLARAHMPQWRVVVEAKPLLPRSCVSGAPADGAVVSVFVWAGESEEAEAYARLAVEAEGFIVLTADATLEQPLTRPATAPGAVARTGYAYYGQEPPALR
jgi:hypothetical protein